MSKSLRTDAAYKRAIKVAQRDTSKHYDVVPELGVSCHASPGDLVVSISDLRGWLIAEISLKDVIAKRKSLRGVNARLKAALRTPKKKSNNKRRK